jgi:hypothetical protein
VDGNKRAVQENVAGMKESTVYRTDEIVTANVCDRSKDRGTTSIASR